MATIREKNCSFSRTSRHLAVVTASGAQKNKLSLQRHCSVPMLYFDTEVEKLNIATRADTMMTALYRPSSWSITNGTVCSSHIQWANTQRHYAIHNLLLMLKAAPLSKTSLIAPRRRRVLQKKRKTTEVITMQHLSVTYHIKSVYQRIL